MSWYLYLRNEHDDLTEVGESTIVAHINHVEGLDVSVGLIKAVQAILTDKRVGILGAFC